MSIPFPKKGQQIPSAPPPITPLIIESAIKYAELGLSVIPVGRDKNPIVKWKGYQRTPADSSRIRGWWRKYPNANIGIVTGRLSNIVSIDFDSQEALDRYQATIEDIDGHLHFKTGKGWQYIFRWTGYGGGNKTGIMENVDIRGEGGYIVVPPSLHENGTTYTWDGNINPLEHGLDELADMPKDTLTFCKKAKKTPEEPIKDANPGSKKDAPSLLSEPPKNGETTRHIKINQMVSDALLNGAKKGSRNSTGAMVAGWMVADYAKQGRSKEEMQAPIVDAMLLWNTRNDPPLPENDIRIICNSIIDRHTFVNLSQAIGSDIYMMEIVYRTGQSPIYNVFASANKAISCTMEELTNLSKFRNKYADMTKCVIPPIKNAEWFSYIQECLQGASERIEEIIESPTFTLGIWLLEESRANTDAKERLLVGPALIDGFIHISSINFQKQIQKDINKNATEVDARKWLRDMGFVKGEQQRVDSNDMGKRIRTWKKRYSDIEKMIFPSINGND